MPLLTGGNVIEGSRPHWRNNAAIPATSTPLFTSATAPIAGALNGIAPPGAIVVALDTGVAYENTGTQAATVWTERGSVI